MITARPTARGPQSQQPSASASRDPVSGRRVKEHFPRDISDVHIVPPAAHHPPLSHDSQQSSLLRDNIRIVSENKCPAVREGTGTRDLIAERLLVCINIRTKKMTTTSEWGEGRRS